MVVLKTPPSGAAPVGLRGDVLVGIHAGLRPHAPQQGRRERLGFDARAQFRGSACWSGPRWPSEGGRGVSDGWDHPGPLRRVRSHCRFRNKGT
jgi:hypothetical protein